MKIFMKLVYENIYETVTSDFHKLTFIVLKDTHRGKALSNKTPTIPKSMNIDIWVVDTSNQPFVRGS